MKEEIDLRSILFNTIIAVIALCLPSLLLAQVTEIEPNGMPDDSGVIRVYEDTQIAGSASFEEDYWPISKSPDASGFINLFITNEDGTSAPMFLERRTSGYNGPVQTTIPAHNGGSGTQFVSLDYSSDYYYVFKIGDLVQGGGSYDYSISGFNPASCSVPSSATAVTISASSSTSFSLTGITGSGGDGFVVKINDSNSLTQPTDGFTLPTSDGTTFLDAGEQVIYIGDGTPNETITALTAGTEYYIAVYNYVDCSGYFEFASAYTTTETTCGVAPDTATDLGIGIETSESVLLNSITGQTGNVNYVIKMNTINSFTAPADGTLPTASTSYVGGEQVIYAGSSATPDELITGLVADTEYFFAVYTSSDCGGTNYFETTGYSTSLTTCNFTDNIASGVVVLSTSTQISIDSFNPLTTSSSEVTPDGYVIKMNDVEVNPIPNGSALPTASTNYVGGSQVVYVGSSSSPQIDVSGGGFSAGQVYYFTIYAYYTSCGSNVYQQSGYNFSIEYGNTNVAQTVNFENIEKSFGDDDFTLSATALPPVSYQLISQTGGGTTLSGNMVSLGNPGTVLMEAQSRGGSDDGGFGTAIATLTISKADPILTFNQVETAGQSTYTLEASTNSDGVISYTLPGTTNGHSLSGTNNETLNSSGTLGAIPVQVSTTETDNFSAATYDGYFVLTESAATQIGLTDEAIFRLEGDGTISILNSNGNGLNGVPVFVNEKWWFVASNGGSNGGGAIMSYDEQADVLTTEYAIDGDLDGTGLSHGLTLYQGKLWGVTDAGTSGVGFFSFDPYSNSYELVSHLSSPKVSQGSELLLLDGKFYLGEKGYTDIIEIDPTDGSHSSAHVLSSGQLFDGIGLSYIDNKLMMATTDGTNDYIYAVDLDTQIGQILASFGNSKNPSHVIDANGKIWGVTIGDSLVSEWGTVFKMDYDGGNFSTVKSFFSMTERLPGRKLAVNSNTIYGFTIKDGTNERGAAYKITSDLMYTKLGALTGLKPSTLPLGFGEEFNQVEPHTTFDGQTLLVNQTIMLSATSSSNGAITFAEDEDNLIGNINGNQFTGLDAGQGPLFAYVAATSLYKADTVEATFIVEKRNRNVNPADLELVYGDDNVKLNFNIPEGDVPHFYDLLTNNTGSSIIGPDLDSLVLGTPGTDQLRITASESDLYLEEEYIIDLIIDKAPSSVAFPLIPMKTVGESFQLSDTTLEGYALNYTSSNTAIATVSGSLVSVVGSGEAEITAFLTDSALYSGSGNSRKLTAFMNPRFVGAVTTVVENGVLFINDQDSLYYLREIENFEDSLGRNLSGHVILSNGQLWAMASSDGVFNSGTIFKMDTNGDNFSVVHQFSQGNRPLGGLIEVDGQLWGMTSLGGDYDGGIIFKIDTTGTNFSIAHHFRNTTGHRPQGSLIESNGKLWGTTEFSQNGYGVVFSIDKDGSNYQVVHEFFDDEKPVGNLIEYKGRLWGVTPTGGAETEGLLYSIDLQGKDFQVHHDFDPEGDNASLTHGQLTPFNDRLYGLGKSGGYGPKGAIYSVDSTGADFRTDYSYGNSSDDGSFPLGWLTEIEGKLWGVNQKGGKHFGNGTIFRFDPVTSSYDKIVDLKPIYGTPEYTTLLPLFEEDSSQTVAFAPIADPIYGDTIIVNASASSGLGITLSSSDLSVATVNVDTIFAVGVGIVDISATQSGDSFWHTADSTISFTVQSRDLEITADAQSKTYGNADSDVLTYQVTSGTLIEGDNLSGSLSRVAGEDVGDYEIQQGSLSAGSNYNLTYVSDNLSITPEPIEITANSQTKVYGSADPNVLTYQFTSGTFYDGDFMSGSLVREAGEHVGVYEIQQGTLDAGSNYMLTYVSDSLTITPKVIDVTADAQSKIFGESDPPLTYEITAGSLSGGDMLSGALSRVAGENAESYDITIGTLTAGSNYELQFISNLLEINAAPVAITLSDLTHVYDGTNKSVTVITDPLNIEVAVNYDLSPSVSDVGTYTVNVAVDEPNYTGSASETFMITERPIIIVADNKLKTTGTSDPPLTYTITSGSLLDGDAVTGSMNRNAGETVGSYAINKGTLALNANYDLTFVSGTFIISDQLTQTITFDPLAYQNIAEDNTLTLSATASSGLTVSYTSSNETVATVSGNVVTLLREGSVDITASQMGDDDYEPAVDVTQSLILSELYIWNGENWNSGNTPPENKKLRIDAGINLSTNDLVAKSVEIMNGAWLWVGDGGSLTCTDSLKNNGILKVFSGGSLITYGAVTGAGYQIERNTTFDINTGKYSLIGSPIQASDFSVLGSNALIYGYDPTALYNPSGNEGLDRFKTPTELGHSTMNVGEGYFSAYTGNATGTVTFVGTPNTGTINVDLDYTDQGILAEAAYQGFNLVSNPYPSAINFTTFMNSNNTTDISGAIYLWDDSNSDMARGNNADYIIANVLGNTDSRNGGLSKWDGTIRSGQGFFVHATAPTSINFTNAMRGGNNGDEGFFRKENNIESFKLLINNQHQAKALIVGFEEGATKGMDRDFDAIGLGGNTLQFYSLQADGNTKLAIQGLPPDYREEVRLGFRADKGAYSISLVDHHSNNYIGNIVLKDHLTNALVSLNEQTYKFITNGGVDNDRFTILTTSELATTVRKERLEDILGYINDEKLHVIFEAGQLKAQSIKLIDLMGNIVLDENIVNIRNNRWSTDVSRLSQSVFVLIVETELGVVNQKVVNQR